MMAESQPFVEKDALLEAAARAVAEAAGDGCFDRIDAGDCGCEGDCSDHEDAAYYRDLARAALSARPTSPGERDKDCTSIGFTGEGRCIEPVERDGLCTEHLSRITPPGGTDG